ncbi:MAG TPA: phosphoenolpyruvate carboxylase [Gemmatimonadaceae bacterium]|nr:phosphoenolpyruvate carboxylase [Gemmatimonadaceae bacterium]
MPSQRSHPTPTFAGPSVRREDVPLHDDVRWLAGALGRVIRRLEGEDAFQTVESIRRAARARRHDAPSALTIDALLAEVERLPIEHVATTARAFTLFFLLINTAEQVHRVRRTRAYRHSENTDPQPGSARWAMRALRADGLAATDVRAALERLDVRPVLTAHPTESTRRTLLQLQARVADILLAADDAPPAERTELEARLDAEVELLWATAEVRQDRPTVKDEVSTVLWYLETRLLDASAAARAALLRAYEEEFGEAPPSPPLLTLGNWVGGDRDGNPNVTPDITLATARRASYAILGRYTDALRGLVSTLSVSATIAPPASELIESLVADREMLPGIYEANRARNEDEPLRLKLTFMAERVEATRRLTASRDAAREHDEPAAYGDVGQLVRDLDLVRASLEANGLDQARATYLDPVIAMVRTHGFHGFLMDVRDHAQMLKDEPEKIRDEMRVIDRIQNELGEAAASTYIVSMTTSADDLLRVLAYAREVGLVDLSAKPPVSRLDVVPLFETLADLEHGPAVMTTLLENAEYRKQIAARGNLQEVMIGYSDSGKDAGMLASSWALYEGQEKLAAVFRKAGVALRFFHGRGGSVGRGGGSPVARALAALPPGTVNVRIKITEQGEIVSQQFGLLPVAERTMEVTLAGTLLQTLQKAPPDDAEFRRVMADLSARGLAVYREMVHEHTELFELFRAVTPIDELADARFGSRPAYRPGAGAGIGGIRAIPWQFGWTQIRLMLPGWLGVGTALSHYTGTTDGLSLMRRMAERWPFFDDLLAKIEMVCAKADLEIARLYVTQLGTGRQVELFTALEAEFDRTVAAVLRIRDSDVLLTGNTVLQSAIALRNPYVDPLSLIQVAMLKRKDKAPSGDAAAAEKVESILATTLSGIAQGLRNTG